MSRKNVAAAVVLLVLSAAYGYLTAGLPKRSLPDTPDPSFFPWIITVCLVILSIALLVQGLQSRRGVGDGPDSAGGLRAPAVFLILFVLYVAVLASVGFVIASVPFFAALMWLYGERRWAWIGAFSIALPVILVVLFRNGLQIPLPTGMLAGFLG
jgi:putative tricarboxylic transport membrane protein